MSDLAKWINDLAGDYVEPWVGEQIANAWEKDKARIEALRAEVEEQARLLGASASREAELLARIEALEKCNTDYGNQVDDACEELLAEMRKVDAQQARIEALDKLLDPETLARKIGDWDFTHNDDYFCFKFGGDGDNGEMLIEALEAILQEPTE